MADRNPANQGTGTNDTSSPQRKEERAASGAVAPYTGATSRRLRRRRPSR